MKALVLVFTLALAAGSLAGCGRRGPSPGGPGASSGIASAHGGGGSGLAAPGAAPPDSTTGAMPPPAPQRAAGGPNSAAGLRWTVPADWTLGGERPMRVATYGIAPAPGDSEGAECAVYYFGANQGGSVEANFQRWVSQFQPATRSQQSTRRVNGLDVSLIDVTGTYTAPGGPMMQSQASKPGWRMRGAIAAGPGGSVFFKLTGPEKTMVGAARGFDRLVASLRRE